MKDYRKMQAWRWGSRVATLGISAGILYYCLHQVKWGDLWAAGRNAALFPAWLAIFVPFLWFWISDTAFTVRSFQWIGKPVRFRDYLVIKTASYLLTAVNFLFSTGGVFLYFMRKTGISFKQQAGLLFFRLLMAGFGTAAVFAAMAVSLLLFQPGLFFQARMEVWAPLIVLFLAIAVEAGRYWHAGRGVLLRRLPLDPAGEFWSAFRQTRLREWTVSWLYTAPPIIANSLGLFAVGRAFHIDVPFFYFFFSIPVVAMISALPVAFGGFGTTTAAWLAFFSAYGTAADIAAATLFIPAARILLRALVGVVFLPPAMKEIAALGETFPTQ